MKKIYAKPEIKTLKLTMTAILAGSTGADTSDAPWGHAKRYSDFWEEEDYAE